MSSAQRRDSNLGCYEQVCLQGEEPPGWSSQLQVNKAEAGLEVSGGQEEETVNPRQKEKGSCFCLRTGAVRVFSPGRLFDLAPRPHSCLFTSRETLWLYKLVLPDYLSVFVCVCLCLRAW